MFGFSLYSKIHPLSLLLKVWRIATLSSFSIKSDIPYLACWILENKNPTDLYSYSSEATVNIAIDSCVGHTLAWQAFPFLPLLTTSLSTKIGIIYTQPLQEEMMFLMIPRSWNMHENTHRFEWKTLSNILCDYRPLHVATPLKSCLSRWCFLRVYSTGSKPSRRHSLQQKEGKKRKRKCTKKKPQKPKDVGHFPV